MVAQAVLYWARSMKMRTPAGKKAVRPARRAARAEVMSLPRVFLFLELFVEKEIPERSTK